MCNLESRWFIARQIEKKNGHLPLSAMSSVKHIFFKLITDGILLKCLKFEVSMPYCTLDLKKMARTAVFLTLNCASGK